MPSCIYRDVKWERKHLKLYSRNCCITNFDLLRYAADYIRSCRFRKHLFELHRKYNNYNL